MRSPSLTISLRACGDWPAGRCLHVLAGHRGWVSDAALAAGGGAGVTASGDELAVVWNLARGTAVNVLAGHAGEVRSVVLTRRGRCVRLFDCLG